MRMIKDQKTKLKIERRILPALAWVEGGAICTWSGDKGEPGTGAEDPELGVGVAPPPDPDPDEPEADVEREESKEMGSGEDACAAETDAAGGVVDVCVVPIGGVGVDELLKACGCCDAVVAADTVDVAFGPSLPSAILFITQSLLLTDPATSPSLPSLASAST